MRAAEPDLAGKVMTVLGPIEPEALGRTLAHEHLFIDLRHSSFVEPPDELEWIAEARVGAIEPSLLAEHSCSVRDNLVLDDVGLAIQEADRFAAAGGGAVVDVTPPDIGRAPEALREVAERTGLAVVMGCGHYCELAHPRELADRSEDQLTAHVVRELVEGVGETGIRPGIIGEIGINGEERTTRRRLGEMTPSERTVLRAAVRAARATGAPITIHLPSRASAVRAVLEELESVGAPLDRVVLGHMDTIPDFDVHQEALERGVWIAYDCFGMSLENEWYSDPGDDLRCDWLAAHRAGGRLGRVLLSHDVWSKGQLAAHGGSGYAHLLIVIVAKLVERGFDDVELDRLFVDNPAELLTFRRPEEARS